MIEHTIKTKKRSMDDETAGQQLCVPSRSTYDQLTHMYCQHWDGHVPCCCWKKSLPLEREQKGIGGLQRWGGGRQVKPPNSEVGLSRSMESLSPRGTMEAPAARLMEYPEEY